jgi:iron-sulfur cluster assembly protein
MNDKYHISVTTIAAINIKNKLTERKTPNAYIRLGVKGGGCSGYTYVLQYEDDMKVDDLLFESEDIKIIVDKKSIHYLNGTSLDWEKTLMFTGFKFNNPLEQSKCGCGHSAVITKEKA